PANRAGRRRGHTKPRGGGVRVRVLIRIGIVSASAAVAATCYDPVVADCQFTCNAGDPCTGDLECVGGFCRVPGATEACMPPPPPNCPQVPMASCGVPVMLSSGHCATLCTTLSNFVGAMSACTSPWRLGIFREAGELSMVPIAANTWVGVEWASGVWIWLDGT